MSLKWYDIDNLEFLKTEIVNKKTEANNLIEKTESLLSNIQSMSWYINSNHTNLYPTGDRPIKPDNIEGYDNFFANINNIIKNDDDRIKLRADIKENNDISKSYFNRVQYILDNVSEDPKALFVSPSGGFWSDYMFEYNMKMLDADNTDVEAMMEIWDYYYADYEKWCKANGKVPTIDDFHKYMLTENPELFNKIIDIIVAKELGVDIRDYSNLTSAERLMIENELIELGFKKGNFGPLTDAELSNLYRSLVAHRLTSASIVAARLGMDSSEIYASSIYDASNGSPKGTLSKVTVPTMKCEYSNVYHSHSGNWEVESNNEAHHDLNSELSRQEFHDYCINLGGRITYSNKEIEINVAENTYKGLEEGDILYQGNDNINSISEVGNKVSKILLDDAEENFNNAENKKNEAYNNMMGVFGNELSEEAILYFASYIPKIGQSIPFIGIAFNITQSQINAIIAYQSSLNEYNDARNDLLRAEAYYNGTHSDGEKIVVDVDGVIR